MSLMSSILTELTSACFDAEIVGDYLKYLLLGKYGCSSSMVAPQVVFCKPCSVAQQRLSESSCYVIVT